MAFDIPATVSVNVTSSSGGPEAGLNVYAFDGTTYANFNEVTDANGTAEFTLLAGDYRFRIDKNGTQFFTDAQNHCTVPGCTSIDYEIPENITVTVTNSGGGVESGLNVYAFDGTTYANKSAVTDVNGEAVFTLLPGNYRFRIDKNGTQYFTDSANHCAAPGCSAVSFEISQNVTVSVSSSSGGPEAGLNVYAFNGSTYANVSAVTDANGEATFTLLDGDYRFRIDKNGTQFFTEPVNHCTLPGCTTASYEVPEDITVTVNSSAGGPEVGLNVYAFDDTTYANKSAVTDANGNAVFTLLPGDYRFRIDKNGTQYFTSPVNNCAAPGCNAASFDIPESVVVTVTSTNGALQEGLNVYAFDDTTYANKTAVTDANGQAVFTLLTGNYRFRVDKDGSQFFSNPVNHCAVPGCAAISAQVAGSLSELVVDPNLGLCLDNTASTNGWGAPADVTSLNCDSFGISNLAGIENFSNLTDLILSNNPITLLGSLNGLSNLTNLDLSGNTLLECNQLGDLDSFLGAGIVAHPSTCLGEGEMIFSIANPNQTDTNQFSFDVATSSTGDLVASAITYNPGTDSFDGRVFLIDGTNGNQLLELENPNPSGSDYFGWAVAILSNGNIAVSAWQDQVGSADAGVVYVFSDLDGTLLETIESPSPNTGDRFGFAIAELGSSLIIGTPNEAGGGAVYLFDSAGNLQQTISNPSGDLNAEFGRAVASLGNDEIIVGAPQQDVLDGPETVVDAGAVHVFDDFATPILLIENPTPTANDDFGSNVAATATNDVVVSARLTDNFADNDGSIALFDGTDGSLLWSVANPVADDNGMFGRGLGSTSQGHIVVGASNYDTDDENAGRVYVFESLEGDLIKIVENPTSAVNANFGQGLAVTPADQVAIGAFGADAGFGELYLFSSVRSGEQFNLLNEQAYTDDIERNCVLSIAAVNGWATVEEAGDFDFGCQSQSSGPDPFEFIDLNDVPTNTLATSNVVTLSGFSGALTATVAVHTQARDPQLSVNGGPFSNQPQLVSSGDTLQLRFVTPDITEFASLATVSIGAIENGGFGIYTDWIVTTGSASSGDPGFDDNYVAYARSGSTDLYIARDESDGAVPGVSGFYLQESGSGSLYFDLIPNKTNGDAIADGFNLGNPLSINLVPGDMSGDGIYDLYIQSPGGGRPEVIVYSQRSVNSTPVAYKEVDFKFNQFFNQLVNYIDNPTGYFYDFTITNSDAITMESLLNSVLDTEEVTEWGWNAVVGPKMADVIERVLFDQTVGTATIEFARGALRRRGVPRDEEYDSFALLGFEGSLEEQLENVRVVLELLWITAPFSDGEFSDSDNDGFSDSEDAFPNNSFEWADTDGDGIGNNTDLDDDNDRMSDTFETLNNFDPLDWTDAELDADGDGLTNLEEFLAGSFPGSGNSGGGGILGPRTLEYLQSGYKAMAIVERLPSVSFAVSANDVKFITEQTLNANDSQTFDSTLGVQYTFSTSFTDMQMGEARFFTSDDPENAFYSKPFTGSSVIIDSKADLGIEDILDELNNNIPIRDFPLTVRFFDENGVESVDDKFVLSVSVVRLLEFELTKVSQPSEPAFEFAYDEEIVVRFKINGVNESALNVSRLDFQIFHQAAPGQPFTQRILNSREIQAEQEIEEIQELYQFTEGLQDIGTYRVTVSAIVENNQLDVPTIDTVSTRTYEFEIVSGAGGSTTTGFTSDYQIFGSGNDFYIAHVDGNGTSIGDLEFRLVATGTGTDYIPVSPPYDPVAIFSMPYYEVDVTSVDTAAFTSSGPISGAVFDVADVNADGLMDLIITDLPGGDGPNFIVFAGNTNSGIVYREITQELVDYFDLFNVQTSSFSNGVDWLFDRFFAGQVLFKGERQAVEIAARDRRVMTILDGDVCPANGTLLSGVIQTGPNSFQPQNTLTDGSSFIACYPAIIRNGSEIPDLTIDRVDSYIMIFTDPGITEATPQSERREVLIAVEFPSSDVLPEVFVPSAEALVPGGFANYVFSRNFDRLNRGLISGFFGSDFSDNMLGELTRILGKVVFDGLLENASNLPDWTGIPGDPTSNDDTQFVLGQIGRIISVIQQTGVLQESNPPGSETNPINSGVIKVGDEEDGAVNVTIGDVTLECGLPTDLPTEQLSCPVSFEWDFLGDGNYQGGLSFETFFYNDSGFYTTQCRIKVDCPTGPTWYAENTVVDVREPLQFGTPNTAGVEVASRNMTAGDPATFYTITETGSPFFGVDFQKTIAVDNAINPLDLKTLLLAGAWQQDPESIEFVAERRMVGNNLVRTTYPIESDEFEIDSDIDQWEMTSYRLGVKYKDRSTLEDAAILVVVNESASTNHTNWADFEQQELDSNNWQASLPSLYGSLGALPDIDPEFELGTGGVCDPDRWKPPFVFGVGIIEFSGSYHPGAVFGMRSEPISGGHGHQATYDINGLLITDPKLGAGSVDKFSPEFGDSHINADVLPFVRAAQLDGNPVEAFLNAIPIRMEGKLLHFGTHLQRYFELRPVEIENVSRLSVGQCQF